MMDMLKEIIERRGRRLTDYDEYILLIILCLLLVLWFADFQRHE